MYLVYNVIKWFTCRETQRAPGLGAGLEAVVVRLGRRARQQGARRQALAQIVSTHTTLDTTLCTAPHSPDDTPCILHVATYSYTLTTLDDTLYTAPACYVKVHLVYCT